MGIVLSNKAVINLESGNFTVHIDLAYPKGGRRHF